MLDNDDAISTNVSEAVEKIPTNEKNHCKCFLCVLLFTGAAYKEQTNI